ncbi:MAG: DNA polymerase III subunit gamma/tau [Microbacterium sp.]|uniref:DNA polymerase III subunit gamma/tau n=1 Tax=Microbacterium sp. TaxID=51671 RepID=UPI0039E48316
MTGRDDDAFSWEGDDDPTLLPGGHAGAEERDATPVASDTEPDAPDPEPVALPEGFHAVGKGSDTVGHIEEDGTVVVPAAKAPMGNAALIGLGVLGGVYMLFAIGWLIGGLRLHPVAGFLVAPDGNASPVWMVGNLVAVWLAVLAPAVWFGTVYWLTARSRPWLRWALLLVGALLLVPWPFVMTGVVGT